MKLCRRNKTAIMQALKIDEKMFQLFLRLVGLDEDFLMSQAEEIETKTEGKKRFHDHASSYDSAASLALEIIDYCLGNHGTEAIRSEMHWDRYFGDAVAIYSNAGDTYDATVLYDISKEVFLVTSCGDWVEANMKLEEAA